ncbi:MAG TPA: plastocyanin/azurin family copper-binding protein [Acidimicrobiia bacterium]|nr:plastocyanin/azurin family copper-binding protein [Acidimicrobiia bacterium]
MAMSTRTASDALGGRRLRAPAAVLVIGLALVVGGCSSDEPTSTTGDTSTVPESPVETRVGVENFSFTPGDLLVAVGTTVEWQNRASGTSHTTTAVDGEWDSGSLEAGGSFSQTFTEAGSFDYFCAIHPAMTGTITVES